MPSEVNTFIHPTSISRAPTVCRVRCEALGPPAPMTTEPPSQPVVFLMWRGLLCPFLAVSRTAATKQDHETFLRDTSMAASSGCLRTEVILPQSVWSFQCLHSCSGMTPVPGAIRAGDLGPLTERASGKRVRGRGLVGQKGPKAPPGHSLPELAPRRPNPRSGKS